MDKEEHGIISTVAREQILPLIKKIGIFHRAVLWWLIRFFAVPITLAASAGFAYLCASSMESTFKDLHIAAAAFGGGVVIATVKELAKTIPSIAEFLESPSLKKLSIPAVVVFTASFSLFASYYIYEGNKKPLQQKPSVFLNFGDPATERHERPSISLTFLNQVPPLTPDGLAPVTFYITFGEEATTEALKKEEGPGMDIDKSDQGLLKNLLRSLFACCEDEKDKVQLELVGFSSSSDWANSEDKSDQNNLDLANARAKKVADFLETEAPSLSENWLSIEFVRWEKLQDMVSGRQFSDKISLKEYSDLRGRLNRRVEIRLINAANCQMYTSGETQSGGS